MGFHQYKGDGRFPRTLESWRRELNIKKYFILFLKISGLWFFNIFIYVKIINGLWSWSSFFLLQTVILVLVYLLWTAYWIVLFLSDRLLRSIILHVRHWWDLAFFQLLWLFSFSQMWEKKLVNIDFLDYVTSPTLCMYGEDTSCYGENKFFDFCYLCFPCLRCMYQHLKNHVHLCRKAINKGIGVDNMHYLNDGLWKVLLTILSRLLFELWTVL